MFERDLPGENKSGLSFQKASDVLPLETCETINGSWGFNITDTKYKSTQQLIRLLVGAASLNANLLLNIGPLPDGSIQKEFKTRLDSIGGWMNQNGESIYHTSGNSLDEQSWGLITEKNDAIYFHIFSDSTNLISIADFPFKPGKLVLLKSGTPIKYQYKKGVLNIDLNGLERDHLNTVLKLNIKRK